MESFKCHLGGWFSDTLGCECSDSLSRLDDGSIDSFDVDFKEEGHLHIGDSMETIFKILLIMFIFDFEPFIIFLEFISFFIEIMSQFLYYDSFERIIKTYNLLVVNDIRYLLLGLLSYLFWS